jgi:2-polyprenyl-6-methoxyphenol hydroxylase-like FAD-dependent oxidoreductase
VYDIIVVGARCAGSPTAMLLARKGYRLLLVDKTSFPSDVVNGYYLQQHAVLQLRRWGLLDKLRSSNCPPLRILTFDFASLASAVLLRRQKMLPRDLHPDASCWIRFWSTQR